MHCLLDIVHVRVMFNATFSRQKTFCVPLVLSLSLPLSLFVVLFFVWSMCIRQHALILLLFQFAKISMPAIQMTGTLFCCWATGEKMYTHVERGREREGARDSPTLSQLAIKSRKYCSGPTMAETAFHLTENTS